jgi:hypothetical protein
MNKKKTNTDDFAPLTWETAAQEAAFEGLCFCMRADGRFINHSAMPAGTPHRNPYSLPDAFFQRYLAGDFAKS